MKPFTTPVRRGSVVPALAAALLLLAGCNSDKILKVTDPDIINPSDVQNAQAAEALRVGAIGRLTQLTSGSGPNNNNDSPFLLGGLLADEWRSADTFNERDETDRRDIQTRNAVNSDSYRTVGRAQLAARQAIAALKLYAPTQTAEIGEMYFILGYAYDLAGETYCNGLIFSDASTGELKYGSPVSDADAFNLAIAHYDSALATATGTDALSLKVQSAAKVGKARALVNLAKYTEAATVASTVPTSSRYLITHSVTTITNQIWSINISGKRYSVAEKDGGNGLPFVSAKDPRVPTCTSASSTCKSLGVTKTVGFDSQTPLVAQLIWADREAPVAIVTGIEARLIQAEAALQAGNVPQWLTALNDLRGTSLTVAGSGGVVGLGPLTDPGTADGRVNLMFRERAFWMFGTGHRLGDMRRLIRQYNRAAETVFPTGVFNTAKGGNFGPDVNIPVPQSESNNANYTGCTDRNA